MRLVVLFFYVRFILQDPIHNCSTSESLTLHAISIIFDWFLFFLGTGARVFVRRPAFLKTQWNPYRTVVMEDEISHLIAIESWP